ncbi:MAG: hypothetical protein HY235_23840 [Acidobacteria bacterium]|nr:hypothetical protein [Acidobacteriota bacterium]
MWSGTYFYLSGFRRLLWRDRRAQDLMEYALVCAGISIVVYAFLPQNYAPALSNVWSRVMCVMVRLTGS